jgi:hypothetical protein
MRIFIFLAAAAMALSAQNAPQSEKPVPHLPDGRPDFNGVWEIPYTPDMSRGLTGGLPFKPEGEAAFKAYDPTKFDYTGHCLPAGLTRLVNTPMPMQIVQGPNNVVLLFEGFASFIVVPTDNRAHPKKMEPTWYGNSVGHYEGDSLVIDSVGFNDKTKLDTIGHPHGDKLHVVQRYTRNANDSLSFEITVEDSEFYSQPFTNKRTFKLRRDWELMEYSCEENNKDASEGHIK